MKMLANLAVGLVIGAVVYTVSYPSRVKAIYSQPPPEPAVVAPPAEPYAAAERRNDYEPALEIKGRMLRVDRSNPDWDTIEEHIAKLAQETYGTEHSKPAIALVVDVIQIVAVRNGTWQHELQKLCETYGVDLVFY